MFLQGKLRIPGILSKCTKMHSSESFNFEKITARPLKVEAKYNLTKPPVNSRVGIHKKFQAHM